MSITSLLLVSFAAVAAENLVFTQFLGVCPFLTVSNRPSAALYAGITVTCTTTLSSFITWLLYHFVLEPFSLTYLTTVVFITTIALLVQGVTLLLKKLLPALYTLLSAYFPLLTTNCAVLGAILLNIYDGFNLLESVVFGFSSAIGFTVAALIFAGIRERLVFSAPPKSFEGLPLLLVSAGLAAMAFAGFSGITIG